MAFAIGVVLALMVGAMATLLGLDRDRAFYPTVVMVIASYYVLFAVMGASRSVLVVETAIAVGFAAVAAAGFRASTWLVVAALALHGGFDLLHPQIVANPGVPPWWPSFCLAYDLAAACYLTALLSRRRKTSTLPTSTRTIPASAREVHR